MTSPIFVYLNSFSLINIVSLFTVTALLSSSCKHVQFSIKQVTNSLYTSFSVTVEFVFFVISGVRIFAGPYLQLLWCNFSHFT
jgi:hypothetical protein